MNISYTIIELPDGRKKVEFKNNNVKSKIYFMFSKNFSVEKLEQLIQKSINQAGGNIDAGG